jgi:hypothetical protein
MNSVYIYVIRCMNSVLYICYELLICSLNFWLTECRRCFKLETGWRFLSSGDGWADVILPVATVAPSSDGRMTSACPSLIGIIVATDIFCPWLLRCYYNDALVATDRLLVSTVTYSPLLQYLFGVVASDDLFCTNELGISVEFNYFCNDQWCICRLDLST